MTTILCNCMKVNTHAVKRAIRQGNKTVDDIKESTQAGTACGGCVPKIEALIPKE